MCLIRVSKADDDDFETPSPQIVRRGTLLESRDVQARAQRSVRIVYEGPLAVENARFAIPQDIGNNQITRNISVNSGPIVVYDRRAKRIVPFPPSPTAIYPSRRSTWNEDINGHVRFEHDAPESVEGSVACEVVEDCEPQKIIPLQTLYSRDLRRDTLQPIVRLLPDRKSMKWAEDEGCARGVYWLMCMDQETNIEVLEAVQKGILARQPQSNIPDLKVWRRNLDMCLLTLIRDSDLRTTWSCMGHSYTFKNRSSSHHQYKSGPRPFFFQPSRHSLDLNLERLHFILACIALCHRFETGAKCDLDESMKHKRDFILGRQILQRTVHECLEEQSLTALNLKGGPKPRDRFHLNLVSTTESQLPRAWGKSERMILRKTISIRQQVEELWTERMRMARKDCCRYHFEHHQEDMEVIWREVYQTISSLKLPVTPVVGALSALGKDQNIARPNAGALQRPMVQRFDSRYRIPQVTNRPSREPEKKPPVWRSLSFNGRGVAKARLRRRYSFDDQNKCHPSLLSISDRPREDGYKRQPCEKRLMEHGKTTFETDPEEHAKKSFIVVGWFPNRLSEPIEACMWFFEGEDFLPALRRQIIQLRGWRQYFSLKTVQAFGLYECDLAHRTHNTYDCSPSERTILAQFYNDCYRKTLTKQLRVSDEWADWVRLNLNNNEESPDGRLLSLPFQCHRSLKLIIRWSRIRLVLTGALPLFLSIAVGLGYMIKHKDPQTAWTLASYVVTAGAFMVALLAVLTQLEDGGEVTLGRGQNKHKDTDIEMADME